MTNILNEKLEICSKDPLTGFTRTGYCDDTTLDSGKHNVCVETDKEFLDYTKSKGNDLYSVVSPGDKWCVCENRYLQAFNDNKAPKVIKNATNNKTKNKIKDIIKMQKAGSKTRKNNRILPKLKKVDSTGKKHKYRLKFTAKKRRLAINEGIMDKSKKMTTRKAATAKKGRLNILRIYRRNKNLKDCNKITSDMRYIDKKYKLGKTKNICGQKGGTKTRKRRKKQKKQFLYNPDDPSKSFDVYIDKNPNDTIPIKYTTVKDVKDTIIKLERLYKTKKYPHKRIWQVGMIMKVRLEAMKKHKKTRYPNAKGVTSRFNLANKYFKFLGKRSKKHSFDERKNMVFKF